MIKLINILQEIQAFGKVTPQMVIDLVNELKITTQISDIIEIFRKYHAYENGIQDIGWGVWIRSLSSKELTFLYVDLKKLKKRPLQEIQAVPAGRIQMIKHGGNNTVFGDQIYYMVDIDGNRSSWGLKDNILYSFWTIVSEDDIENEDIEFLKSKKIPFQIEFGENDYRHFKRIKILHPHKYFFFQN